MRVHEDYHRNFVDRRSSDRSFGFVFTVFLAAVGLWPLRLGHSAWWWALIPAGAFLAAALIRPRLLAPLNKAWSRLGMLMNSVVQPIVMAVLFFVVFVPIGWIVRRLQKDHLGMAFDPAATTYWQLRVPPGPAPETMNRQF